MNSKLISFIANARPITMIAKALAVGGIAFGLSHTHEKDKSDNIPLAFSEIGKTKRKYEAQGEKTPPLTRFYSITNDIVMKVFESNNDGNSTTYWSSDKGFAQELEYHMDPAFKTHALISEYAEEIPHVAEDALKSLDKYVGIKNDLDGVVSELDQAWDDSHLDIYLPKLVPVTTCDSKGNCTTTMTIQMEYSHTIHTYEYDEVHGNKGAALLSEFMLKHPDVNLTESLILASGTEADNEYAIWKSMREQIGSNPTPEQYLQLTNTWATGSTLSTYSPVIRDNHSNIGLRTPQWNAAKGTAHSDSYSTGSPYDSGPQEFQICESALESGQAIQAAVGNIVGGIEFAAANAPVLNEKAQDFINISLNGKESEQDPEELGEEVLNLAHEMYKQNFETGFDTKPYKWWKVALWTLLGVAAGAGGGRLLENYAEGKEQSTRWRSSGYDFD